MRIRSIEPTPNPNSMKLNMDESLPDGVRWDCSREHPAKGPDHVRALLAIDGVRSIYQVADFIAIERNPKSDWRVILAEARRLLAGDGISRQAEQVLAGEQAYGAVHVWLQVIRNLPMQVKLVTDSEEVRVALPERFGEAARQAAQASPDFLAERKWVEKGVRYGDLSTIGEEVVQQVSAAYDEERLKRLSERAAAQSHVRKDEPEEFLSPAAVSAALQEPDWRLRYAALDRLDPQPEHLALLVQAMQDAHHTVRRLAIVYLGALGGEQVLPHLIAALRDPSVAVRRAAGDSLSDLGDPAAIGPMADALSDPSRLVRWRAARYLYEVGDASALPALRVAAEDAQFEVSLQAQMAIERIEGGTEAVGPAWQQMTRLMADREKT